MNEQPPDPTIKGHPAVILPNAFDNPVTITVCANCGEMRSILWLDEDRWYCNKCRVEGASRPSVFPLN